MPRRRLHQRRGHQEQAAVPLQRLWLSAHRGRTRGGRQALQLYLEGMGFRAIGRFLEVSHVAVYYWVKSFGKAVESARNTTTEVKVVEMDELHSYV
ncbi:MAG: IS1 family transposase, partial [Methyloglobulus sp.]|nr:IS1 family transposase [Methyloglobulus sp.]